MTVAIYGASSSKIDPLYISEAEELGRLLALRGIGIICGGGRGGLMAAVTDGALSSGGRVPGVLPGFMVDRGWDHPGLTERIVTETMHRRKATMLSRADAVIALPGGIGTFDELFEAMTWRQLKLWNGPLVMLDTLGFYKPVAALLDTMAEGGFMRPGSGRLYDLAASPAEAVSMIVP